MDDGQASDPVTPSSRQWARIPTTAQMANGIEAYHGTWLCAWLDPELLDSGMVFWSVDSYAPPFRVGALGFSRRRSRPDVVPRGEFGLLCAGQTTTLKNRGPFLALTRQATFCRHLVGRARSY